MGGTPFISIADRALVWEDAFSHSVTLWDVYRYQSISHSSSRLNTMYSRIMSCVTWSCEKIQTLFIFRAICDNAAHVQWIRRSPKGSHLIHWTSAVFSHIALKWTPFAYLIGPPKFVLSWISVINSQLLTIESNLLLYQPLICRKFCYFSILKWCF